MKKTLIYIAAAVLGVTALSSCDDDFTRPPLVLPETLQIEPTMTTEAFKTQYWSTIQSGPAAIGMTAEGDSIILTGRVCSSDQSGNIYKNVVVQSHDAEGNQIALSFSVNRNDIYELFPFGQEVAIYATGLNIGPYRKLLQFGAVNGDQMTFMDEAVFTAHVFRNKYALPEPEKVDTTVATLKEIVAAKSNDKDLMMWQSRLVRVNGVSFQDAGKQFAGQQTADRYVTDSEGNRLNVRNSSYSDFSDAILPYGTGSVVGILSYYQSDWQLLLIDKEGCIDFDGVAPEPGPDATPEGEGTADSPYNTVKALEVATALPADQTTDKDYYVKGKVSAIKEISPSYGNGTYSITSEGTSVAFDIYRGYYLNGEKFTSEDQLKVGDEVVVCGKFVNFKGNTPQMAQGGKIVSLNGKTSGSDTPTPPSGDETGEGSESSPYTVAQVIAKGADVNETGKWVEGYIVGFIPTGGASTTLPYTEFSATGAIASNLVLAPTADCTDPSLCIPVQLPSGSSVRAAANLLDHPENLGKALTIKGDITKYCGAPGVKSPTECKIDGEGGGDTPTPPSGDSYTYSLVSEVTSGASYVLVVDGQYGAPIAASSSFGRFNLTDATIANDSFSGPADAAFVLTMVDGKGYTMTDHLGRYLSMDDSHFTTFQIFDAPQAGSYWTVEFTDGKVKITNALNTNCFVCVSKGNEGTYYSNMAPAKEPADYKLPQLFKAE